MLALNNMTAFDRNWRLLAMSEPIVSEITNIRDIHYILHLILHQILTMYYNIGSVIGALSLSSMTSSRVFLDSDVQATQDYLTW